MEDNMEVENLSEKVTEGSGYDEGIVDNDVELETVREDDLGETKIKKEAFLKFWSNEETGGGRNWDQSWKWTWNGSGNINTELDEKPKFSINISWTMLTQSEDKVNHVNLVWLDPGGTVSAVMEIE